MAASMTVEASSVVSFPFIDSELLSPLRAGRYRRRGADVLVVHAMVPVCRGAKG
jgi:hypothetical protein